LTGRTKTEKESESAITMCDRMQMYNITILILEAALGPGVRSASKRNEYQKQKNNVSGEWSAAICEPIV
jgi:hypothetical protein